MENIFLQQDASEKIKITIKEDILLYQIKKYFKWRKDITVNRVNKLGTYERDKFIKHLHSKNNY